MSGFDGSGNFTLTNPTFVAGTTITAASANSNNTDVTGGFNNTLTRDGQGKPSADIDWNAKKITNLANATARSGASAAAQVQDGGFVWGGTTGGAANAYTISLTPAITAYAAGQRFAAIVHAANTGAATINVNSVGVKSITKQGAAALSSGDMPINSVAFLIYDGTQFQLIDVASVQTGDIAASAVTAAKIASDAVTTAKILDANVTTAKIADNAITGAKIAMGSDAHGDILFYNGTDYARLGAGTAGQLLQTQGAGANPAWATAGGKLLKYDSSLISTYGSTATVIPGDDSIPQSTEGAEATTLAFTPTSASSTLKITVTAHLANSFGGAQIVAALFKDAGADALAVGWYLAGGAVAGSQVVTFVYFEAAGSTSARTYKLRYGPSAGTAYINGHSTSRQYGGVVKSGIVVEELG
ncbi:MAG: hypothetical protein FJX78_05925 [Armatimonadetes bacterium]|nr:hypothetical protein [Armatimonadota bacterium]